MGWAVRGGIIVCLAAGSGAAMGADHPCPTDLAEPFGVVNFFDLAAYLQSHVAGLPSADIAAPWGTINFFDLAAYLGAFTTGCGTDTDSDGIPDWAETDDGVFRNAFATGTDPTNPDTDGDGLGDGDEVFGTPGGLDLPGLGADPLRKDIFVECDWFAGEFEGVFRDFRPRPAAVDRVVQAFADAPVENPYAGPAGISIHIDYGQGGAFTGGQLIPGNPLFISFPGDFQQYKSAYFTPERLGYFHYALFANRYNAPDNRSSGVAEIVGDDFMVTLLDYVSSFNQSQTLMHELGHNLGLRHGGFENRNYKPNYNSVMNYRHQFPGVDTDGNTWGNGALDFSWGINNPLDEAALFEPLGVLGEPVDFNLDGVIQALPYARNINCPTGTSPCGDGSVCWDSQCVLLLDHDDWSAIAWHRLAAAAGRAPAEIIECDNEPPGHHAHAAEPPTSVPTE